LINYRNILSVLAVATFIFISYQVVNLAYTSSPLYDDSYNATIAKSLAFGIGYVSSYHEFIQFNSEVTTGPVMLLPAALMIKIFSNKYWVPHLIGVLFSLGGLLLLGIILKSTFNDLTRFALFSIFALSGLFLFTTESYGSGEGGFLRVWFRLLGDLPCSIMVAIGIVLLSRNDKKNILIGGIFLGCATLIKSISLISCLATVLVFIVSQFKSTRFVHCIITIGLLIIAINIPSSIFRNYKKFKFNDKQLWEMHLDDEYRTLRDKGSGLGSFISSPDRISHVKNNFYRNSEILKNHLGGSFSFWCLISVLFCGTILLVASCKNSMRYIIATIGMCVILNLAWWLGFSDRGWIRHFIPGITLIFLLLGLLVANTTNLKIRSIMIIFIVVVFGIKSKEIFPMLKWNWEKEPRLLALINTTNYLSKQKPPFLGCDWWAHRDLEYMLPKFKNFVDCLKLTENEIPNKLLVTSDFWNWGENPAISALEARCTKDLPVFEDPPFRVSRCS
jgi:hypothetical protein